MNNTLKKRVCNFQLVTITVNAVAGRYYFEDQPNLRDCIIQRISVYTAADFAKDLNNISLQSQVLTSQAYLTLVSGATEVIQKMDMSLLNPIEGGNSRNFNHGNLPLNDLEIIFDKSYVEFSTVTVPAVAAPFVFCFGIYYIKKSQIK